MDAEQERDQLREIIAWALGEYGDFPERPERVPGKPYPMYYWRREMRNKLAAIDAHLAQKREEPK